MSTPRIITFRGVLCCAKIFDLPLRVDVMAYWQTAAASLFVAPHWPDVTAKLLWFVVAIWAAGFLVTVVALLRQRLIAPTTDERLKRVDAPLVSVLVPARDEAGRVLRESLRSLLAQDYGNFEVCVVDDRSTDATPRILRTLAAEDARLTVVTGAETPAGWLGKPYAMQQALERARGEWVLATDADMIFHTAALRTAVAYADASGCDALSFIPHFEALSFWERLFIPVWYWSLLVIYPLDIVNHPRTPLALGLGGFFLMRRAALEQVGGYESVRAEVLEDVRLAETLKRAAFRTRAEYAPRLVSTRMYTNLSELWESATKNWFAGFRFSHALTLFGLAWTFTVAVLPPLAALACLFAVLFGSSAAQVISIFTPAAVASVLQVASMAVVNRRCGVPVAYATAAPLGFALSCAVMFDSAFRVTTGRGVLWKGRRIYEREGVRPPRARAGN
ncbi:MAG TPA: glycosyltransferase family 2 protein [Pyrinomonadaceae bacterium]|nr:glycosyltransferase family 2 protein [Pyrinomonadaceae bacterium]